MRPQLPQLIPSEICLDCPVCCRFPEKQAGLSPFFFPLERTQTEQLKPEGAFREAGPARPSKAELVACGHGFAPRDAGLGVAVAISAAINLL